MGRILAPIFQKEKTEHMDDVVSGLAIGAPIIPEKGVHHRTDGTDDDVIPQSSGSILVHELLAAINDRSWEADTSKDNQHLIDALQAKFWAIRDQATEQEHIAVLRAYDRRIRDAAHHAEEIMQYGEEHFDADEKRRTYAEALNADAVFSDEDWYGDVFFEEGEHQKGYCVVRDEKILGIPIEECTDDELRRLARRLRRNSVSSLNHCHTLTAVLVERALARRDRAKEQATA
jgi:hypothetical protein